MDKPIAHITEDGRGHRFYEHLIGTGTVPGEKVNFLRNSGHTEELG